MDALIDELEANISPIRWYGVKNPAVAALNPLKNKGDMREGWPEVPPRLQARLDSVVARIVLAGTVFETSPPDGFRVETDFDATVTFAHTSQFIEWMGAAATDSFTINTNGLSRWALLGRGPICLGARAVETFLDTAPQAYETPDTWKTSVRMFVAPLNPEFEALMLAI